MANPVQINDGLHVEAVSGVGKTTAQEARNAQAATVAHDGAGAVLGVFYEGTQTLITGTATTSPSMQVSVSPLGFAGQKASTEGVYLGRSVGTVLVDVAAAPASNSRIDTVYVMQRDANSNTSPDGLTQGEIGVVTGTAGVSPTAPAAPAGAVVLGTVQVAAGVTATTNAGCTITTSCRWTTGAGAPLPVRGQSERDALTAYNGLRVYRLDLKVTEVYDGTAWQGTHATYAPTLTSNGGTGPALGTGGVQTGRWVRNNGRIQGWGYILFGTGFGAGTGTYKFGLPVPANFPGGTQVSVGAALLYDSSAATIYHGTARLADANTVFISGNFTGYNAGATSPVAPGSSDWYSFEFDYEPA